MENAQVRSVWCVLFLLLLWNCSFLSACGVGKSSYTKKDYQPFRQFQQKPEEEEESAVASGPFHHKIKYGSKEFRTKLVRYVGTNVVFKDDEGTGADRYMTKVCRIRFYFPCLFFIFPYLNAFSISGLSKIHGSVDWKVKAFQDSVFLKMFAINYVKFLYQSFLAFIPIMVVRKSFLASFWMQNSSLLDFEKLKFHSLSELIQYQMRWNTVLFQ